MGLRDLYTLSETIRDKINNDDLPEEILDKMEIKMVFKPTVFYGIDKEFYYMTHNNRYEGFVHSEMVNAKINGVKFNIVGEREETTEII